MSMYYPPKRPDEIYHWGIKKGEESKKHKYFARIITGVKNGQNVYRYFYDKKEWDAYNASKHQGPNTNQKVGDVKVTHDDGDAQTISKSSGPSLISRILFGAIGSQIVEIGKNIVSNILNASNNITVNTEDAKVVTQTTEPKVDNSYNEKQTLVPEKKTETSKAAPQDEKVAKRIKAADENGGIEHPEGEAKYKYVAKIPMGDGTFRYFYSQEELRAYYEATNDPLLDVLDLKKSPFDENGDHAEINERYNPDNTTDPNGEGDEHNCYSCSLAYELRRRGYDAESILDSDGEDYDVVTNLYDAPIKKPQISNNVYDVSKSMEESMLSEGDGASGHIMVYWRGGGGHDMTWQVKSGRLFIIDNQEGSVYYGDYIPQLLSYTLFEFDTGVSWQRTDNAELNYKEVKKYIQKN